MSLSDMDELYDLRDRVRELENAVVDYERGVLTLNELVELADPRHALALRAVTGGRR